MDRRSFLALGLGLGAAALLPGTAAGTPTAAAARPAGTLATPKPGRRKLGALEVSALGLGCM
jgi:hypothetical protein